MQREVRWILQQSVLLEDLNGNNKLYTSLIYMYMQAEELLDAQTTICSTQFLADDFSTVGFLTL